MEAKGIRHGTRVRVQECRRRPTLEALEGKITKCFGGERYVAYEVQLDDGRRELFWPHELKKARNQPLWVNFQYALR
jgi:hypothetical protein